MAKQLALDDSDSSDDAGLRVNEASRGGVELRLGRSVRPRSRARRAERRARRAGSLSVAAAAVRARRVCMARDLLKTAFFYRAFRSRRAVPALPRRAPNGLDMFEVNMLG